MLPHEKDKLEAIKLHYDKYWVPINWIYALIFKARKEGHVPSDSFANKLCDVRLHSGFFKSNFL